MNTLWFVKYEDKTDFNTIVFTFTLDAKSTEAHAFEHGRTMINPDYVSGYRNVTAEIICRTRDTVMCFEPC